MKIERDTRLTERCNILAHTIVAVRPIYSGASTTSNQRQLLETMIGAALWYMPQLKSHWTGQISMAVLKKFHPECVG